MNLDPKYISSILDEIPILKDIIAKFHKEESFTLFLFGGAVRDLILSNSPGHDLDFILVSNKPTLEADKIFTTILNVICNLCNTKAKLYSRDHAVIFNIKGTEITIDIHYPEKTLLSGLCRSDYTINGIAFDMKSRTFIDPLGGLKDIQNKQLSIHSPNYVITNPPNFPRLYRAAAKIGFEIPREVSDLVKTYSSMVSMHDGSGNVRVLYEFLKFLSLPKFYIYFEKLIEDGLLGNMFPEILPLIKNTALFEENLNLLKKSEHIELLPKDLLDLLNLRFAHISQITQLGVIRFVILFSGFGKSYFELKPFSSYMEGIEAKSTKDFSEVMTKNILSYMVSRYKEHQEAMMLIGDLPLLVSQLDSTLNIVEFNVNNSLPELIKKKLSIIKALKQLRAEY